MRSESVASVEVRQPGGQETGGAGQMEQTSLPGGPRTSIYPNAGPFHVPVPDRRRANLTVPVLQAEDPNQSRYLEPEFIHVLVLHVHTLVIEARGYADSSGLASAFSLDFPGDGVPSHGRSNGRGRATFVIKLGDDVSPLKRGHGGAQHLQEGLQVQQDPCASWQSQPNETDTLGSRYRRRLPIIDWMAATVRSPSLRSRMLYLQLNSAT